MTASTLIVRTLATQEEREQYCWLTEEAFYPSPTPEGARRHLHFFQTLPNHQPEQWRGVFLGGKLVGGCFIGSRLLRMGRALLPTGCIGGVVTHPEYRKRGVAAALMQDAIRYSQTQRLALLMLDGIADFYHRYGYIDVFDSEVQEVQRAALLAHAPSAYTVRQATEGDAEPLLALYERQYNHYTGSFVRTLADQQHKLQHYGEDRLVILASDSTGAPRGYALLSRSKPERVAELAADDWEATLALAQYHARLFTNEGVPEALRYRIPPQGAVTQRLIDRLSLPVDPKGEKSWVVRGEAIHYRRAGWMARPGHMFTLLEAVLPEWQSHWERMAERWTGVIRFEVGEEAFTLNLDEAGVYLSDQIVPGAEIVRLTPQAFMQLLFGYRPASYLLQETGQRVKGEVGDALHVLFPAYHTWIAPSDWF